jgi:hypothetical protein
MNQLKELEEVNAAQARMAKHFKRCHDITKLKRFDLECYGEPFSFFRTRITTLRFVKLAHSIYDERNPSPFGWFSSADIAVTTPEAAKTFQLKDAHKSARHARRFLLNRSHPASVYDWHTGDNAEFDRATQTGNIANIHIMNHEILAEIPNGALVEARVALFAVTEHCSVDLKEFDLEENLICWKDGFFGGEDCSAAWIDKPRIIKKNAMKRPSLGEITNKILRDMISA